MAMNIFFSFFLESYTWIVRNGYRDLAAFSNFSTFVNIYVRHGCKNSGYCLWLERCYAVLEAEKKTPVIEHNLLMTTCLNNCHTPHLGIFIRKIT